MRSTVQNLEVLYEDNHLIAVNKKSGDLVQGDQTGDKPLVEVVRDWLRKKYNKPGNVFTGVVHRIDRPVSGVVLFAKTSKALSRLNELFKSKQVTKTYLAAVCERPEKVEATLKSFLIKDSQKNKSRSIRRKNIGNAKESVLTYRYVASSDKYHLLQVRPQTGRHHQIRVQLSEMGCPIKGDVKYGAPRTNKDGSIHLHARSLEITHPVRKEPLKLEAPVPEDPVWNAFRDKLT